MCNLNENEIVQKLQATCDKDGKETNIKESAKLFHQLGLVYWDKRPDKISLIRSTALLNAAICRNPDNKKKIKEDLGKFCSEILLFAKAKNKDFNLPKLAEQVAEDVAEMRNKVKNRLRDVPIISLDASDDDFNRFKKEKIDIIMGLENEITEDYKTIMSKISGFCAEIMGEPPCEFALVGLGSVARKEVTPYSDFENIIVLKDQNQHCENYPKILEYFRWFTLIFQVILINLGETMIPCLDIPSLNGSCSDFKFYDAYTTRGVSFDGMVPYACKSPLGRQFKTKNKPFTLELIQPVSTMANFIGTDQILKNGYHLADMLMSSCFVYGSQKIYTEFQNSVKEKTSLFTSQEFFAFIKDQISHENRLGFTLASQLGLGKRKSETNIKVLMYRTLTLFISCLGKMYNITEPSGCGIIDRLENLTDQNRLDLKFSVAVACESRLNVYARKERQDDIVQYLQTIEICGVRSMVEYFAISAILQENIFFRERKFVGDQLSERLMAFYTLGFYQEALDWIFPRLQPPSGQSTQNQEQALELATIHFWIGMCESKLDKNKEAIEYLEKEISNLEKYASPPTFVWPCHVTLFHNYMLLKKYTKAFMSIQKVCRDILPFFDGLEKISSLMSCLEFSSSTFPKNEIIASVYKELNFRNTSARIMITFSGTITNYEKLMELIQTFVINTIGKNQAKIDKILLEKSLKFVNAFNEIFGLLKRFLDPEENTPVDSIMWELIKTVVNHVSIMKLFVLAIAEVQVVDAKTAVFNIVKSFDQTNTKKDTSQTDFEELSLD